MLGALRAQDDVKWRDKTYAGNGGEFMIFLIILLFLVYLAVVILITGKRSEKSMVATGSSGLLDPVPSIDETPVPGSCPEEILDVEDAEEALRWRLKLLKDAEKSVDLAVFEFHRDAAGIDMMAAIKDCADRGLRVRILIDGICSFYRLFSCEEFKALSAHPSVEVRIYNPMNVLLPWKLLYRMHDKYMIVDDSCFLIGGRNISLSFLGDYPGRKKEDYDLIIRETEPGRGEAYQALRAYYETVWDSLYTRLYRKSDMSPEKLARGNARLDAYFKRLQRTESCVYEDPDFMSGAPFMKAESIRIITNPVDLSFSEPTIMRMALSDVLKGKDVLLQSPYFICSRDMWSAMQTAAQKVEHLDFIMNSAECGSNIFGSSDYMKHKGEILQYGVGIHEYFHKDKALHGKLVLIDDDLSYIGSCNMDVRSAYIDQEIAVRIRSKELNARLRASTEELKDHCVYLKAGEEPLVGKKYAPGIMSSTRRFACKVLAACGRPFHDFM